MSKKLILPAILVLVIVLSGCTAPTPVPAGDSVLAQACTNSGGTIITRMCCLSASNFPNTCLMGACGCSAENSHLVNVCKCGEGQCFDGERCKTAQNLEQDCIDSGGTVTTSSCCLSAGDFPNTCVIGACGCSPENSHQIKSCECREGQCFDGQRCANLMQIT